MSVHSSEAKKNEAKILILVPGFGLRRCSEAGWAVELLVFREESIHCKDTASKNRDLCLYSSGSRKFVVSTEETLVVQTHK